MNIRRADRPPAERDIATAMAIMDCAFPPEYGEGWTDEQLRSTLRMPGIDLFIGGRASTSAGFALTRTVIDETELLLIAVAPQFRRKSLASHMLADIEDQLQTEGVTKIYLEMRAGNTAEALYQRLGFTQIGFRPDYYQGAGSERFDAITFCKTIISDK